MLVKKFSTVRTTMYPIKLSKYTITLFIWPVKKWHAIYQIILWKHNPKMTNHMTSLIENSPSWNYYLKPTSAWNCFKQFFVASLLLRTPVHLKICVVLKFFKQLKKFFSVILSSIHKERDSKLNYPASLIRKVMMMNKLKETPQKFP